MSAVMSVEVNLNKRSIREIKILCAVGDRVASVDVKRLTGVVHVGNQWTNTF
jgi:hypothetical protein